VLILRALFMRDFFQRRHSIRRISPALGRLRFIFGRQGEYFHQYFFAGARDKIPRTMAAAVWLTLAGTACAQEHVWLIGGGYNRDNSEAQIEQNVIWAATALRHLPGKRRLQIYFTDGLHAGYDVKELRRMPDSSFEPLSRLYEFGRRNLYILRNHRIPGVAGGTARATLEPALLKAFSRLKPGDRVLVVFNGHGTPAKRGHQRHRIWLWNETWLDVRDVERLFSRIPDGVTVRFVFTQCYAGGFARTIHPGAADTLKLARGERCGFMSVAGDRPAEGCSAAIDIGSYRDYTTYFFAALSGRARDGAVLARDPDMDRDGRITPYDAHLYALSVARSADVPRSTSEDFLERWQPHLPDWRQLGVTSAPATNVYSRLAAELARREGFDIESPGYEAGWLGQRRLLVQSRRETQRDLRRLDRQIKRLRAEMTRALEQQQPGIEGLADQYRGELTLKMRLAIERVRRHPRYPRLVELQDREDRLLETMVDLERRIAQLDRIDRLLKLSRWLNRFESSASAADRASYRRLLRCEKRPLSGQ